MAVNVHLDLEGYVPAVAAMLCTLRGVKMLIHTLHQVSPLDKHDRPTALQSG